MSRQNIAPKKPGKHNPTIRPRASDLLVNSFLVIAVIIFLPSKAAITNPHAPCIDAPFLHSAFFLLPS
jgi:hypothetical protein